MNEIDIYDTWRETSVTTVEFEEEEYVEWLDGDEPTLENFKEFLYDIQNNFDSHFINSDITDSHIKNVERLFETIIKTF